MSEIEVITYEQARTDFLKLEMEKAQNRMKFWQTKIKKAKNAIAEMEAHDNASNAGWEYNFYKDALEALENNRFQYETGFTKGFEAAQPKWISVKERLPDDEVDVLVYVASKKENVDSVIAITHYTHTMHGYNIEGWCSPWQYCFWDREVTHWMPLPSPPKEDE